MKFNKQPSIKIEDIEVFAGWEQIAAKIAQSGSANRKKVVVVECYQGVYVQQLTKILQHKLSSTLTIEESDFLLSEESIEEKTVSYITDDRIFGKLNGLMLSDFVDRDKKNQCKKVIEEITEGIILVVGTGASLIWENPDVLVYADMARWELQLRMRRNEVSNIGRSNIEAGIEEKYKIGFFLDWRVCDVHKQDILKNSDFVLDTNRTNDPLMVVTSDYFEMMNQAVKQPFSLVPFFDPGPWGGQWMRRVCGLGNEEDNFAWCFNCVPEENSILFDLGDNHLFESPSINLVFFETDMLLGSRVREEFGAEFPIRFDFLDTIEGGNLSLQVHPSRDFIKQEFGLDYTQDESYYMLDADPGAEVYLGVKSGIDPKAMIKALKTANEGGESFPAEEYTVTWPAKKHDHFLIPNGTVHCSGEGCMVLEISATPYIFTFKMWDWNRLGLDGRPRPINVERAEKVICWNIDEQWVGDHLVNKIELLEQGEHWREERTGLDQTQFIETRRHWFTDSITHNANGSVHVFNLVEGEEVTVSSVDGSFTPFIVNYAETFVIPAGISEYVITPTGNSKGKEVATVKAYVRD